VETTSLPEDKFVKVNGIDLHYLDWGNLHADPVLLVHGLCSNAHYWDYFADSMKNDYHTLAIDLRGHGESDHAGNYGPRNYSFDLDVFVACLGLNNFHLIGHSLGGINSIIFAANHPDLVKTLVIVDIGPEIGKAGVERMERERINEPTTFSSEQMAFAYMKKMEPHQSEDFIRHQLKYALRTEPNGGLAFKYDKALLCTDLRSPEWLWEYLSRIICPVLLVRGMESDMLTAEVVSRMLEVLISGTVVEIEQAGHGIPGDNPYAFEAAVRDFFIKH
jgi:pimeloyl-ACP methyl ester carboxylesterase